MSLDVLVCINGHPRSHMVVDAALRKLKETGSSWRVLYVDPTDGGVGYTRRHERTMRLLERAEAAGAEVVHLEVADSGAAKIDYIQACFEAGEEITHIFVGQIAENGLSAVLKRSTADKVARKFGHRSHVTVVPLEGALAKPSFWERLNLGVFSWEHIMAPVVAVAAAFLIAECVRAMLPMIMHRINMHNIALIFLLACVIVSLRFGLLSALVASALSFAVINYFYVVPIGQFNLSTLTDFINITIYLGAAIIVSVMGGHVRASVENARLKERRSRALYDIHQLTSGADSKHQVLEILDREVHKLFNMEVAFFLPLGSREDTLGRDEVTFSRYPSHSQLEQKDMLALQKCWQQGQTAGFGALLGIGSSWRFEVMETGQKKYGVFGVKIPMKARLDPGFGQLMNSMTDHVAATLERVELMNEMTDSRFREEREKLRSMLLSSVSHDLKTPLASIIGSISVLRSLKKSGRVTEEQEETLTETALDEAQRLDSFITNILSMTRIESGEIEFANHEHDPMEPVRTVLKALKPRLKEREVKVSGDTDGVRVMMDAMMTTQVLQNIIDNAAKYSPENAAIDLSLEVSDGHFRYHVRDHGDGIPENMLDRIFDKYERLNKTDSQVAGTGLGLAIAKSVMGAQGGDVTVANHKEGGAVFTLHFPFNDSERMEAAQ
ncbi:ATP-binding protein [Kordiimonas aestuarii]|uniref:ATP-binding protein n=1 Tax=Kordiimonas aestuarii TaxID=1005925 RepID=UPI0021D18BFC|nr:ATP-binding protein [Kordiimonas aestuarii]